MSISSKGIDLIKAFEGCRLRAYECPAGIPTIGYGTTFYPNGQPVQMKDEISEQQAEAYLANDCEDLSKDVERLVKVSLNQNQKDALISFCYNLGVGAFTRSTLLKKLNQGDYQGAAAEFPRWDKAIVDGVKQSLPGLVRRRAEEKALFEMVGNEGQVVSLEPSAKDKATWLEIYRDPDGKSIVAAWNGSELVELVGLDRAIKEDLASVLMQYKNAKNVLVAPPNKPLPDAKLVTLEGPDKDVAPPLQPLPDLGDKILQRGSKCQEVGWLQERLKDLGYYQGEIDEDFGTGTDAAVKNFQAAIFGSSEADGKVGSKTWTALCGKPPKPESTPFIDPIGGNYLRLTWTSSKDQFGLYKLHLSYIKNGQEKDHLFVCSGQANRQNFRIGKESKSGSMEPLPEGKWYVHDMQWAGGKDNYQASWKPGLGPVKIWLEYKGPDWTERSEIMIHIDWNRQPPRGHCPGTAGCIGLYNIADCKRLVTWLRDTDPRDLYVNWDLGTCPKPLANPQVVTA
jgi:lysozyme